MPNQETENKPLCHSSTDEMTIGKVKYIVTTHFNPEGRENAEDKLLRLVIDRISDELKSEKPAVIELT
jgi:hypothetical protein